ncbi:MAG: hypothetical protein BWY82_02591 [Verrucomicrobia bacterium ADurb.Bin474]|nr:MAG: hypothetical protein BWY82_02591 [Verrucomicrobia bacterium ADurb.Bin474]
MHALINPKNSHHVPDSRSGNGVVEETQTVQTHTPRMNKLNPRRTHHNAVHGCIHLFHNTLLKIALFDVVNRDENNGLSIEYLPSCLLNDRARSLRKKKQLGVYRVVENPKTNQQ